MKDRIAQIMKKEQMYAIQFAKETGIQQASLSHILNGRNNPSLEIIKKIHLRFPSINLDWLLYGEGEMTNDSTEDNGPKIDENAINPTDSQEFSENDKEIASKEADSAHKESVKETIRYIEKPSKKIVEIKIFFDDGTFETLVPKS